MIPHRSIDIWNNHNVEVVRAKNSKARNLPVNIDTEQYEHNSFPVCWPGGSVVQCSA